MPLQTFFNLEINRKKEIIDAACEEFALNNYKTASVSNIVKKLGIAKGSFYRYFESKLDLYSYLIEVANKMRMEQLNILVVQNPYNFFEILKENFRNKLQFDMEYPLLSGLMYNVMLEFNNKEVEPIVTNLKKRVFKIIDDLLIQFQKINVIRKDINRGQASFLIYQVQLGIYEYLAIYKGVNYEENIKNKAPIFSLSETEMMEVVEGFTNIIKIGLKSNFNN